MAKSFRFPRWVGKTRTYSIHPVAFIDQPVATPHQPRYAQQLPPGEAKAAAPPGSPSWRPLRNSKNFWLTATNVLHPLSQICRFRSAAKSASSPFGGALGKTRIRFHSSDRTPSVSPFGLTAPSEREPRALRACGRLRAAPTGTVELIGLQHPTKYTPPGRVQAPVLCRIGCQPFIIGFPGNFFGAEVIF